MQQTILGLSGQAGSGKTTAAKYLEQLGYRLVAFADPLKSGVAGMFGFTGEQVNGKLKEEIDTRFGKSPRYVLQYLGSHCREIWPEVFIAGVRRELYRHPGLIVVTDIRYLNEATALRRLGAIMIRLERAEAGAVNGIESHALEMELDDWLGWDETIHNDGSTYDLKKSLGYILQNYQLPPFNRLG